MADTCLLFDNGKWYVVAEDERRELPLSIGDTPSHDSMAPLTVYVDNHARLEKIKTPRHWQELEELAERESRILYLYRGCRLVKIIRSLNLKKKLYAPQ